MPTYREYSDGTRRYRVKRKLPGLGKVNRSLQTDDRQTAEARERALLALCQQGQQDVVRAWLDGDVSIARVHEAHAKGEIPALVQEIRRQDEDLGDAIRAALRDKSPDVAESTLERYTTGLDHFRRFVAHSGDIEADGVRDALTRDVIQAFKIHRREKDDAAKQTVNNDLGAVSILATYAKRKGWIDQRPEIGKYSTSSRVRWMDPDEFAAYMAELRPAFRPLFQLLAGTGMRLGEAEALTPADLDLGNGDSRARVTDAKTPTGVRPVFLPDWVANALREHLEASQRTNRKPIFDIPRRTAQGEHNKATARIGLDDFTVHDLRHHAAVHMAKAGMPMPLIKRQLGHSNLEQTMKYADYHPEYGDFGRYFDRMGERFGLSEPEDGTDPVNAAAELLDVEPEALTRMLDAASDDVEVAA